MIQSTLQQTSWTAAVVGKALDSTTMAVQEAYWLIVSFRMSPD